MPPNPRQGFSCLLGTWLVTTSLGHMPVVDHNFRSATDLKEEAIAETKRREFIHMPDPDVLIYNFRTMVERVNGRLKDEFGGRTVRVLSLIHI